MFDSWCVWQGIEGGSENKIVYLTILEETRRIIVATIASVVIRATFPLDLEGMCYDVAGKSLCSAGTRVSTLMTSGFAEMSMVSMTIYIYIYMKNLKISADSSFL